MINVKVHTNSKKNEVIKIDNYNYEIYTNVVPENGKANKNVIELLSDFFKIGKTRIKIVKGEKNKIKVIEILNTQ